MQRNYRQEIEKILKVITDFSLNLTSTSEVFLEGKVGRLTFKMAREGDEWVLSFFSPVNPHYLEIDRIPVGEYPEEEIRQWYQSCRDVEWMREFFWTEVDGCFSGN